MRLIRWFWHVPGKPSTRVVRGRIIAPFAVSAIVALLVGIIVVILFGSHSGLVTGQLFGGLGAVLTAVSTFRAAFSEDSSTYEPLSTQAPASTRLTNRDFTVIRSGLGLIFASFITQLLATVFDVK